MTWRGSFYPCTRTDQCTDSSHIHTCTHSAGPQIGPPFVIYFNMLVWVLYLVLSLKLPEKIQISSFSRDLCKLYWGSRNLSSWVFSISELKGISTLFLVLCWEQISRLYLFKYIVGVLFLKSYLSKDKPSNTPGGFILRTQVSDLSGWSVIFQW